MPVRLGLSPRCYRANSSLVAKIFSGSPRKSFVGGREYGLREFDQLCPLTLPSPSGGGGAPAPVRALSNGHSLRSSIRSAPSALSAVKISVAAEPRWVIC